MVYCGTEK
jgi:hypothetical protein